MMTVAINPVLNNLDPLKAYNYHHFILIQCLFDTLVNLNETGDITSAIVKKWEISPDGLEYIFELKKDAKFHDGSLIHSEDVIFSLSRHLWPESNSVVKYYLESIEGPKGLIDGKNIVGVTEVTPSKFKIKLSKITPSFLYILTMPSFSIVSKNAYDKDKKIIGSGRMTLEQSGDSVELKSWHEYSGDRPKLEKIKIVEFTDSEMIAEQIKSGKIDMVIGLSTAAAESVKLENIKQDTIKSLVYSHLFYNMKKTAIFSNEDFRKDLTALLQNIAKKVSEKSFFLEFLPTYFPKGIMPKEYYEIKKNEIALDLFAEKWGKNLNKEPLTFVLVKSVYPTVFFDELQEAFDKMKIKIDIKKVKSKEYAAHLKSHDYDVISGLYMGNFPDPDGFIEPIIQGNDSSYGVMPIQEELKRIDDVNKIKTKYDRLTGYAKLFRKVEGKFYFAPMFRDKIPLLYKVGLEISGSDYRYESELWKMFWKDEK